MDGKQQAIVELPTLSSQEASKRHHEEELQVLARTCAPQRPRLARLSSRCL
jgi:hypothetical protein